MQHRRRQQIFQAAKRSFTVPAAQTPVKTV